MGKKAFRIDAARCTGCLSCVIACKDEHVGNRHGAWTAPQPDTGHFWMNVVGNERGKLPRVRMTYLPLLCQHCDNAACIKACPEGAIVKWENGLVSIDPEGCTGCGLCKDACPYDVIYWNANLNIAQKCTGCVHRVENGEVPRCMEACPHDVISFGDEEGVLLSEVAGELEVLLPETSAKPRVYYKDLPRPRIAGTAVGFASNEILSGVFVRAVDLFDDSIATSVSDEFGDFQVDGLDEEHKYLVTAEAEGYEAVKRVVTASGDVSLGDIYFTRRMT